MHAQPEIHAETRDCCEAVDEYHRASEGRRAEVLFVSLVVCISGQQCFPADAYRVRCPPIHHGIQCLLAAASGGNVYRYPVSTHTVTAFSTWPRGMLVTRGHCCVLYHARCRAMLRCLCPPLRAGTAMQLDGRPAPLRTGAGTQAICSDRARTICASHRSARRL